jgi:hypothetical protein
LYQSHVLSFLAEHFLDNYGLLTADDEGVQHCSFSMKCFPERQQCLILPSLLPQVVIGAMVEGGGALHCANPSVQSVDPTTCKDHRVIGTYWHLEHTGPLHSQMPKFELAKVESLEDHFKTNEPPQ